MSSDIFDSDLQEVITNHNFDESMLLVKPTSYRFNSTNRVIYKCHLCFCEINIHLRVFRNRYRGVTKHDITLCNTCNYAKKPPKSDFFAKKILPIFISQNLDPTTVIKKPTNINDFLEYNCLCGEKVSKSTETFYRYKSYFCKKCTTYKKTGPKSLSPKTISSRLYKMGFEIIDISGYQNCLSNITVKDVSTGKSFETTYNRLQQGHRSKEEANENMKLPLEEVKKRVKLAAFSWIDNKSKYINKLTKITVLCQCGREDDVLVGNLHQDRIGCTKCFRYQRKYPWQYVVELAIDKGCKIFEDQSEKYSGRDTKITFECVCKNITTKSVRNFLHATACKKCISYERYGTEYPCQNEEVKSKIQKSCKKYRETHDTNDPNIILKRETTCLEKYGVRNVMQDPIIYSKCVKKAFRFKPYVFPSGRVDYVQGYENYCLDKLLEEGYEEDDIVTLNTDVPKVQYIYDGKSHYYFMDAYIKSIDLAIECKSDYTYNCEFDKNNAKWLATTNICKKGIVIYTFNKKKKLHFKRIITQTEDYKIEFY